MMFWPAVVNALQRQRWATVLEKSAPPSLTVARAADLLQVDRERFLAYLRGHLEMAVGLSSEVSRQTLVDRLRRAPSP
jgi:hypothetical protein